MVVPAQPAGLPAVLRVVLNPRLIMVVALLGGAAARSLRERRLRARRREVSRRKALERKRAREGGGDDQGEDANEQTS